MNVLTNKIKLTKEVNRQENEIKQLNDEKKQHLQELSNLNEKVRRLSTQIEEMEKKYVNTGKECEFCYTNLQNDFLFCPKCGKKVSMKQKQIQIEVHNELFGIETDRDGLIINQYNGFNEKSIRIPTSIHGQKVIGIWNGVFEKCVDLEEVYFEEGCKYIGKNVFADCIRLKRIHLPKSLLEIGDAAFLNCGIEEVAIPPNIDVIGKQAFSTRSLKKIVLPEGLKYISEGMLQHTNIEEISIPLSVSYIGAFAFSNTKLKTVELPNNVYSVDSFAFDIEGLEKITIHSNVKKMNNYIFGNDNKNNPIVNCALGSKAQLYARKYGLKCNEISQQSESSARPFAEKVVVELGSYSKGESLEEWYRYFGFCKAETWSWYYRDHFTIHITKVMDMKEAENIRDKIRAFANIHGDWTKPGVHCTIMKLDIWRCGENSEV